VLAVSAFTVQSARTPLLRARDLLESLPAPRIAFPEPAFIYASGAPLDRLMGTAPRHADGARAGDEQLGWGLQTGLAHDHIGVVATGVLSGVSFRRADLRGDKAHGPDSGTFDVDDDGAPRVISEQHIPVTISLPATPPPPDGYPIAIFGHGLGASRVQMLAFAETLAREGWALAAIDASGHGSRFNEDDDDNNIAKLMSSFTGESAMADGFGDVEGIGTAFELFHEMRNIAAMRDEMRQSVLDLSQLALALRSQGLDLSPLRPSDPTSTRVDASHLIYLGESFGSVLGAVFSAVEPHVGAFILDVPGGGILDMMACHAPQLRAMVTLYVPSLYGVDGDTLDRFHPLIGFGNAMLDAADPLSYARHVLRDRPRVGGARLPPRHVVLIMAEGDEVLANSGTIALGKTLGMPMLAPHTTTHGLDSVKGPVAGNVLGQTAVVMQQAPATHGRNWTEVNAVRKVYPFDLDAISFEQLEQGVPVTNPVEETHDMLRKFLRDITAGHAPTVEATPEPVEDFDDDGVLDADDDTPYGS
jgi:Platelet-activating factor acetylhydrolase, isoform II